MKGQIVSATLYDVITLLLRSVGDSGRMKNRILEMLGRTFGETIVANKSMRGKIALMNTSN